MDRRRLSPLAHRILMVNILALAILVVGVMVLGRYKERLIVDELAGLSADARILAVALAEGAALSDERSGLEPERARRMVRRLVEPADARTRLFDASGALLADSDDFQEAALPAPERDEEELPPASRWVLNDLEQLYELIADHLQGRGALPVFDDRSLRHAGQLSELQQALKGEAHSAAQATPDGGLMLIAVMPVEQNKRVVGAVLLNHGGETIGAAVQSLRVDILHCFLIALAVTVALSFYLAGTIVEPIRRLALAAERVRHGRGRQRIPDFSCRNDEIGDLSRALGEMTDALWARLDAIEHFAADVAHEIKNPLTSLRSAVETAARIEDAERRRPLMAIIEDDIRRLDRLITDISAASRVDAELSRAERAPVDLGAMLSMLAEIHAATAAENPALPCVVVELPEGAGLTVSGFEGRLVQVFQNLIANALSFSPPGGTVTLSARRDGDGVAVAVGDRGPGIPEGKLQAIFERFYTERPPGEKFGIHSGLGLSISKQIIEAHHGSITAENRCGPDGGVAGAVFTVRLPLKN
ncbi:MAG: stimulus-sensing domain-containing protein [Rhodospirillaceae bacterium]